MESEICLDLIDWIEKQVQVCGSTKSYLSLTYEPYITLLSSGIKKEGEGQSLWCKTPEKAIELFKYEFNKYRWNTGYLKLHWRIKPTLHETVITDSFDEQKYTFYNVRARLLLTNKNVIYYDKRTIKRGSYIITKGFGL